MTNFDSCKLIATWAEESWTNQEEFRYAFKSRSDVKI